MGTTINLKDESFANAIAALGLLLGLAFLYQVYNHYAGGLNYSAVITNELFPMPDGPLPRPSAIYDGLLPLMTFLSSIGLLVGSVFLYLRHRFARPTLYVSSFALVFVAITRFIYLIGFYAVMAQTLKEFIGDARSEMPEELALLLPLRLIELRNWDFLCIGGSLVMMVIFIGGVYLNGKSKSAA